MNKIELNMWLKDHPEIDHSDIEYDGSGNEWHTSYHKVGNDYYAVNWLNNRLLEDCHKGKGYQKDSYTPRPVKKVTKVTTVTSYEPIYPPEEDIDLDSINWDDFEQ
jgi:hypothetical protein